MTETKSRKSAGPTYICQLVLSLITEKETPSLALAYFPDDHFLLVLRGEVGPVVQVGLRRDEDELLVLKSSRHLRKRIFV
jgi:hypothetical protein